MISRNIWHDAKTEKPKLARTVFDGAIRLQESEPVFLRLEFENGVTDYVAAVYREATEFKGGHRHTNDAYFATIYEEEFATIYEANDISAWMYPPKPDAIDADWLIEQMNGDCDYCEHLTNLRDNSPCMNCIHAPVGSILPDETTKNNWTITKTYRPSIEERTVYPG